MLEIIKRLFKREDKAIPEEVVSDYPSGEMSISCDGETGNFCIKMNVEESDEPSAETLGLLLFHLDNGNLTETLIKAVTYWAEDEEERNPKEPTSKKFSPSAFLAGVLSTWYQSEEVFQAGVNAEQEKQNSLAIDPSEVFNLKQGLKEE
jgi:hypothetical protein